MYFILLSINIYICRNENGPVLIASPAGGMDIEDVAVNSPELIKKIPIDIYEGISDEVALDVAKFLNFDGPLANMASIAHTIILTFYNINIKIYFSYLLLIGCQ
jgi:succinyl-CoA synthetase beta subunit